MLIKVTGGRVTVNDPSPRVIKLASTGPAGPAGTTIAGFGAWSSSVSTYVAYSCVSYNGSSYISNAAAYNTDVPGVSSKWVLLASQGATGATGATGASILTGTNTPAGGSNGDYFFATDTKILYGPKVSGAWPGSGTSLKGDTGAASTVAGPTGPQGAGFEGITSSSTNTQSGSGTKTFALTTPLGYHALSVGQQVRVAVTASPTIYMDALITSVSATSMIVSVTYGVGSGTFSAWTVSVTGTRGATGATGATGSISTTGVTDNQSTTPYNSVQVNQYGQVVTGTSTLRTAYASTASPGTTGTPLSVATSIIRVSNTTTATTNCVLPTPTSSTAGQLLLVRNDSLGQLNFYVGATQLKNAAGAFVTAAKQTSVVFVNDGAATPAWVYFGKLSV